MAHAALMTDTVGMELLERVRNALEDSAVFLQEQGNFFRVEHFFELAFERPVALLRRFLPDAVENSGQESCAGFRMGKEEQDRKSVV